MTEDRWWQAQWLIGELHDFETNPKYRHESYENTHDEVLGFLMGLRKPVRELGVESDPECWR